METTSALLFYEVSPLVNLGRDITDLTYSFDKRLAVGQLVEIPVGRRRAVGVVMRATTRPDFATKPITQQLQLANENAVLPSQLVRLATWLAQFYSTSLTMVWPIILPSGLLKNRRPLNQNLILTDKNIEQKIYSNDQITLNDSQAKALAVLRAMSSNTAILRGVTGSGKTEIYKHLALDAIRKHQSAIILVPEISLTTQLVDDFRQTFSGVAEVIITHSAQKETERFATWQQALTAGNQPLVAIGPRSALFLPLQKPGLIVIDEAHEPTYVQDKTPRYDAKTVAAKLAQLAGAKLILGSATPLVTDVYRAQKLQRSIVEMTKLARAGAKTADIKIVDMTAHAQSHTGLPIFSSESRVFSLPLLNAMKRALAEHKQVLLFHNRRGTATTTLCENCGWVAECPRCFLPLTLHADQFELRCHICNYHAKVPTQCPTCGHVDIVYKGLGTKKIEDECRRLFREIITQNDKAIRRFDGDTPSADSVANVYDELKNGTTRIIIGTQQIAKGLDLPLLSVVGVVQADAGLNLPDFGARERTFQLVSQAVGRVGRTNEPTTAIIQTYQPNAPAIRFAKNQDFWGFYQAELPLRKNGHFPPFAHLLKITVSYKTEMTAVAHARQIVTFIQQNYADKVSILGPTPAFHERLRDKYRWQIIVRSNNRAVLAVIIQKIPPAKWQAELDPNSLI
ncbi:MAG: primosomal protein N' [Candidatus Nanoperiomorbaceae bacterium]